MQTKNKKLLAFLGATSLAGALAILSVITGFIQIGQTERDSSRGDETNATLIAIQNEQLDALNELATLQTDNENNDITNSKVSVVLFSNNFEDEDLKPATFWGGGESIWKTIKDEMGNWVLDGDNSAAKYPYPRIMLGSTDWDNYELRLRVRFIGESPEWTAGNVYFRSSASLQNYAVRLNPHNDDIVLAHFNKTDSTIEYLIYNLKTQKWYDIAIIAVDNKITVLIDNTVIFDIEDSRRKKGNINIVAEAGIHMQIDNIEVISIP